MTEILDAIELELVGAVRRRNARARRRRRTGFFTGIAVAATLATGVGVATVVDTPLDTLFSSSVQQAQPTDARRSAVVVGDGAGVGWSVISYRSRGDLLSTTIVQRPRRAGGTPVSGVAGLLLALDRHDRGRLFRTGSDVVVSGGRVHAVVFGTVDESVAALAVTVGGRRYDATLAETAIRIPVILPPRSAVSPAARPKLARLPAQVVMRSFAVALTPDAVRATVEAPATFELTLGDGTVVSQETSLCVSARCTQNQAAVPGRAG